MAKSTFIDIGTSGFDSPMIGKSTKEPYYPTINVTEADGFDPEVDDEVVLKGIVTRCVDDSEGGESYTIKITGVQCDCEGDLASAMDKIAKKKMAAKEDYDE